MLLFFLDQTEPLQSEKGNTRKVMSFSQVIINIWGTEIQHNLLKPTAEKRSSFLNAFLKSKPFFKTGKKYILLKASLSI